MVGIRTPLVLFLVVLIGQAALPAGAPQKRSAKEAFQAFHDLIGPWKGTGIPTGTREEQQRNFWVEELLWEWQFKGTDAWLKVACTKGKYLEGGELRYLSDKDAYQLTLRTTAKDTQTFTGKLKERVLTLERQDDKSGETQRFVFTMLHPERHLYRYDIKPKGRTLFNKVYQVGCTRQGIEFAKGDGRPECIVSGGLGTTAVNYMGKTYYVCCSGCRDEFNANPGKYVAEYEKKKKR
ncbi:MAG: YHS domain-containing protein [Gemmataceae bacterium]|nr:YHS domain-containing protein [Gemmataceae bacterium]